MENLMMEKAPPFKPGDDLRLVRVWDHFYAYCFTIINQCPGVRKLSAADREDCVQDVMMELVRRFGVREPEELREELTGWIRVLSRNKAADIMRRRYRKPEVAFDDGSGEFVLDKGAAKEGAEIVEGEYVSLIWEALGSLDSQVPVTSYLIFYLRSLEGWKISEIATLFQISPEQTRARCHRVKKKFGTILKSQGGAQLR